MKLIKIGFLCVFLLINVILVFSLAGLDNPPGEFVEDTNILTVSPTTFTLSSTQTEIQITLTAKDPYVYKDAYFCKAPCRQLSDWIFLGEFTGTPKGGNYLDGKGNGVSNQFTISKSNLNSGNNFVAVYTCKGYNNCNTKKWVKQKFVMNCDSQFLQNIGSQGSADGQFLNYGPRNIALDSLGNIYVTESNMFRIQKLSSTGQFITKWGSQGTGDGQFNAPWGIAIDSAGNVYVSDGSNSRIQKFSSTGQFIAKWGTKGGGNGQFDLPWAIAVDKSDNIYVVDSNNYRVQKFNSNGQFITKWGSQGTGNGQFTHIEAITVDGSGNVYVGDRTRIQKFDSNGQFITQIGSGQFGNGMGPPFNAIWGLALDNFNNVYAVNYINNNIIKFSSIGEVVSTIGTLGSGNGQFNAPGGIVIDNLRNYLYVTDYLNFRVEKFSICGG